LPGPFRHYCRSEKTGTVGFQLDNLKSLNGTTIRPPAWRKTPDAVVLEPDLLSEQDDFFLGQM